MADGVRICSPHRYTLPEYFLTSFPAPPRPT